MIQTRFDRENTACDDCILWATCLAPLVVCCCECAGVDVPDGIENLVDCMQITVSGCMLAQQQVEVQHVQKTGFMGVNPGIVAALNPAQQCMIGQGKPMGGRAAQATAAGAVVGGAAGAAAMYSAAGGRQMEAPMPHLMGNQHQQHPKFEKQRVVPVSNASAPGGFMQTMAPNGMQWAQYCQSQPAFVDATSDHLAGAWGECLAWAKVFELQNHGWPQDPNFQQEGPCGQVIEAMLRSCPPQSKDHLEAAANRLETLCEAAAASRRPLPVIGQIV